MRDLARFSPRPEKNGQAFARVGVSEALFRKLRTRERSLTARSHETIVAELNRRLAAVLREKRASARQRALLDRLCRRHWLAVNRSRLTAHVKPRALLACAKDRFSARVEVKRGRLHVSITGRRAIGEFEALELARQVQPRQMAVAVHHFLAQLTRGQAPGNAVRRVRKRLQPHRMTTPT